MHKLDPARISMYLADRIGRKIPLIVGGIFYGAFIALVGFIEIAALLILMILVGISAAILYPPTFALVGDLAKEKRGFAIGGANLFGSLGFAMGPIFSTSLLGFFGYGETFFIIGLIILAAFLILAQALRTI